MSEQPALPKEFSDATKALQKGEKQPKGKADRKVAASVPAASRPSDKSQVLQITRDPTKAEDRQFADLVTSGIAVNATTTMRFCTQDHGGQSLTEMVNSLEANGQSVNRGDLASLERMLTAQAISLNTMFAEMARRASLSKRLAIPP